MGHYLKIFAAVLLVSHLALLAGCATLPEEEEGATNKRDALIGSLTEENTALRAEVERLTRENEALMEEKLRAEEVVMPEEMEEIEEPEQAPIIK